MKALNVGHAPAPLIAAADFHHVRIGIDGNYLLIAPSQRCRPLAIAATGIEDFAPATKPRHFHPGFVMGIVELKDKIVVIVYAEGSDFLNKICILRQRSEGRHPKSPLCAFCVKRTSLPDPDIPVPVVTGKMGRLSAEIMNLPGFLRFEFEPVAVLVKQAGESKVTIFGSQDTVTVLAAAAEHCDMGPG